MSNKRKKKQVNELTAVSKFIDAFVDGLKSNTADRIIKKAEKSEVERQAIEKMKQIQREKDELEDILSKIPKAKVKRKF